MESSYVVVLAVFSALISTELVSAINNRWLRYIAAILLGCVLVALLVVGLRWIEAKVF